MFYCSHKNNYKVIHTWWNVFQSTVYSFLKKRLQPIKTRLEQPYYQWAKVWGFTWLAGTLLKLTDSVNKKRCICPNSILVQIRRVSYPWKHKCSLLHCCNTSFIPDMYQKELRYFAQEKLRKKPPFSSASYSEFVFVKWFYG